MKIVLIRHFKVGFKWKTFYNAQEYETACAGYNAAAVIKTPLELPPTDKLITSTMPRALETSRIVFARDPDHSHEELCEVPIKPFVKTSLRLPKIIWDIFGRLQWRLNLKPQPESFRDSKRRVHLFLDALIDEGDDAIIVCHGWIMKLMIPKLLSSGFKGPNPLYIVNGLPYKYVKS
jgi:broad specificity phosphatase PhoE